uniref:Hgm1 protein n=1 Tax=Heterodera glycines TaxID=51029 RepID=O46125_HETGL|nr:Hgm1 protein [Heterodera glycines]
MNLHTIFSVLLCALVLSCAVGKPPAKKGQQSKKADVIAKAAAGEPAEVKNDGKAKKSATVVPVAAGPVGASNDAKGTTAGGNKATGDTGTTKPSAGGSATTDDDDDDDESPSPSAAAGGATTTDGKAKPSGDGTATTLSGGGGKASSAAKVGSGGTTVPAKGEETTAVKVDENSKGTDETEKPEGSTDATITGDTFTKVNKIADEITECEFYFVHLENVKANEKEKLWTRTKQEAEIDTEEMAEDSVDYRIVTPAISKDQPDMGTLYEQDTDDLPSDPDDLRKEEYFAADTELVDAEFLKKNTSNLYDETDCHGIFGRNEIRHGKSWTIFQKGNSLMKHRFCLFSPDDQLQNTAKTASQVHARCCCYNKNVSDSLRDFDISKTADADAIRAKHIDNEYALFQKNQSSTMALRGSLVGEDGQAVYFSIWSKSAPGSYGLCTAEDGKNSRGKRQAEDDEAFYDNYDDE